MSGSLNLIHELFMRWFLNSKITILLDQTDIRRNWVGSFLYDLILMTHYDLINFREQFIS